MTDYKTMYLHLFYRVSDAVSTLEAMIFGHAKTLLICAQQEAEERYLEQGKADK